MFYKIERAALRKRVEFFLSQQARCEICQTQKNGFTTFPNTEKRVENTTRSGVFLTNVEVFGNVVKHCLECLIYLLNRNLIKEKTEK